MLNKVLVANRGEIAIRVMRECKELGIKTVAVYSEVDKHALFARYADESYCIGAAPASQSYLNVEKIVDVAEKAGVEGIHPGYGFLAENPAFAKVCESHGIQFIGPTSATIELMGNKIAARARMEKANVPVVPGSKEIIDAEDAIKAAEKIGYPLMVKASAGGGGIGMRVAYKKEDLIPAIESTRAVAKSAFGDASVFLEKYLETPRHIEFQILADTNGNILHLGERECSIQRRHQKLIEEGPSPVMTEELRERMGAAAIKAASSVDYVNAGTVEFLYSKGDFYFLEMNTRLQVEHPVTEMTTGVDIVKEQLGIASGKRLSYTQGDIHLNGCAIECRINAEDPLNNFAPAPGKIIRYRSPGGPGIRVDSGVHMGYTIPSYYDSMISKLIAWSKNRNDTIKRMKRALFEYIIIGVKTNIAFHKAVMNNEAFKRGELTTRFVEEQNIIEDVKKIIPEQETLAAKLGAVFTENKKAAVVSAAVGAYMNRYKVLADQEKES